MIRNRWAAAAAAMMLLLALAVGAAAKVEKMRGTVRTTEHPEPHVLQTLRIDGVDYLDLQDVARIFRATKYWRAELSKMVLKVEGKRVTLTVGSPFVFVETKGTNLFAPVLWSDGRMVVPMTLVTNVLDPLVPERVTWSRDTHDLRVVTGSPNIERLSFEIQENGTLASIALDEPLEGEFSRPESTRAVIRVHGGRLVDGFETRMTGTGLVDSAVVTEEPDAAVFTFYLAPTVGSAELVSRTGPPRLELSVRPPVSSEGEVPSPDLETPAGFGAPREVHTVVLDPGHGGPDKGVVASGGTVEKDVTLAIAKKTKDLLEHAGFTVHLTRENDSFVSPDARSRVANANKADVFVSLHANAWFDSDLSGFTVEVPRPPMVAAATTDAVHPWGERDAATARDSETLAEMVTRKLQETLKKPGRGVRAGEWAPLTGTSMPAVLVECGFLTNNGEAKKLADGDYQSHLAKAIADAVKDYRDALARGGDAGGGGTQ